MPIHFLMMTTIFLSCLLIFLLPLSLFIAFLYRKERIKNQILEKEQTEALIQVKTLQAHLDSLHQIQQERSGLKAEFKLVAEETLEKTQEKWLNQAQKQFKEIHLGVQHDLEKKEIAFFHLVHPVKETLAKLDEKLTGFQKEKHGNDEVFKAQLEKMFHIETELAKETKALVSALKSSSVRGVWGEITLKRLVEMAGLVSQCDFFEQQAVGDEEKYRPDLVVRLPNQRFLVVDAKVPLSAYLLAQEEENRDKKKEYLEKHAKQLRLHIQLLSKKQYYTQFTTSPEFVILFLPVDQIYQAALEADPTLIEYSSNQSVVIATPISLIGLLKSIHYAWKQEVISLNAQAISEQGEELAKAISTLFEHFEKLGRALTSGVISYNQLIGSIESRFIPKAAKLKKLLGQDDPIEGMIPIEKVIRNYKEPSD